MKISFSVLLLFFSFLLFSQDYSLNGPLTIGPQNLKEITFDVSGILDDNLSGPQAVCFVELSFNHNSISTLEVEVISPTGQSTQLIGPGLSTSLGSSEFITWDVLFAISDFPAFPDSGFDEAWNSANNWLPFTNYQGRYYPSQEDLDGINVGSANGMWKIRVENLSDSGSGTFEFISLKFCNPDGLECNICYADAGSFDLLSSQVFCVNDPFLSDVSNFIAVGEEASFNAENYNYAILEGDNILSLENDSDLNSYSAGTYTICGVINKQADQGALKNISSLSVLRDVFNDGTYCGAVMSNCIDIIIEEPQTQSTVQKQYVQARWFQ